MKVLLLSLIVHCATFAFTYDLNPNIPIDAGLGCPSFVEPQRILEAALYPFLIKLGIHDIDVDSVRHESAVFQIELSSTKELSQDFQMTLRNILKSDLGLGDISVNLSPMRHHHSNHHGNVRSSYYIHFNPDTFVDVMKPLAQKNFASSHLSLEESMWE